MADTMSEKSAHEALPVENSLSPDTASDTEFQDLDEDEYPHGIRLIFVVIALSLSMFLVCSLAPVVVDPMSTADILLSRLLWIWSAPPFTNLREETD